MKQFIRKIAKGTSFIMLSILFSTSFGFLNGMQPVDQDRGIKWINREEYNDDTILQWQEQHCIENASEEVKKNFAKDQREVFFEHKNIENFIKNNPLDLANKPETVETACNQIINNLQENQKSLFKKNQTENYLPVFLYEDDVYTEKDDFNDDSLEFLKGQGQFELPLDIIPYNYLEIQTEEVKQKATELVGLQFNGIFTKLKSDNLFHLNTYEKIHFLWMLTSYAQEVIKIKFSSNEATFLPATILKFVDALWGVLNKLSFFELNISKKYTTIAGSIATTSYQIALEQEDLITSIIGDNFYENINTIKSFIESTHENIEDNNELHFKIMMMFCCLKINNFVLKETEINEQVIKFQAEEQPGLFSRAKNWLLGAGALAITGSLVYLFAKTNQKPIENIIYVNNTSTPLPQNTTTAMTPMGNIVLNAPEDMCAETPGLFCKNTFDDKATLARNLSEHTNGTHTFVCDNQGQCINRNDLAIVDAELNRTKVTDILNKENQNTIKPNFNRYCNFTKHGDKCPELLALSENNQKIITNLKNISDSFCDGIFDKNLTITEQYPVDNANEQKIKINELVPAIKKASLDKIIIEYNNTIATVTEQFENKLPKLNNETSLINITDLPTVKNQFDEINKIQNEINKVKNQNYTELHLLTSFLDKQQIKLDNLKNTTNNWKNVLEKITIVNILNEKLQINIREDWSVVSQKYTLPTYAILFEGANKSYELIKIKLADPKSASYNQKDIKTFPNNLKVEKTNFSSSQNKNFPKMEKIFGMDAPQNSTELAPQANYLHREFFHEVVKIVINEYLQN